MSNHYVSLARGAEGTSYLDYTTGTSSSASDLFEFRVLDGVTPSRLEVVKALEAIERFFENAQQVSAAGFDVGG